MMKMLERNETNPNHLNLWSQANLNSEPAERSPTTSDWEDGAFSGHLRFLLAAIVESSDDAIISKNLNGIITSWNAAAGRMFGYTAKEIIGQSILRLIPDELRHEEDEILTKLRAGERIDHYETLRVKKNGETIEVSITISPVKDNTGHIIGASKVARDISERKQVEQLLIQSEKLAATGRMAATIAHEINNPLESLMNLIFLARESSSSKSEARTYLLTAEKELERVAHIVQRTLGYYRDTGAPVEIYLHELVEDVITVYQSKLSASGISVDYRFEDSRPIAVHKGELVQVFSNVIANSIDAMRHGGKLYIRIGRTAGSDDNGIEIVIRDQGTGIKQEHLANIFEPFFTTKGNLGTGIGLWVTKQLVEKHGGRIVVKSSTDPGNSGTTVAIYLPLVSPRAAQPDNRLEV
jgi:PAS domain S-box-containing protein